MNATDKAYEIAEKFNYKKRHCINCVEEIISTINIDVIRVNHVMQTSEYWQKVKDKIKEITSKKT